jgi:hypothetical protein
MRIWVWKIIDLDIEDFEFEVVSDSKDDAHQKAMKYLEDNNMNDWDMLALIKKSVPISEIEKELGFDKIKPIQLTKSDEDDHDQKANIIEELYIRELKEFVSPFMRWED